MLRVAAVVFGRRGLTCSVLCASPDFIFIFFFWIVSFVRSVSFVNVAPPRLAWLLQVHINSCLDGALSLAPGSGPVAGGGGSGGGGGGGVSEGSGRGAGGSAVVSASRRCE